MSIKLPFGLQNGQIVDISSVENGLACNCFCPACGQQLIAKKGAVKEHHFAHYNGEECREAVEIALRIYAKDILEKHKRMILPPIEFEDYNGIIYPATEITFETVTLEWLTESVVPDIVVTVKNKKLLVEISVAYSVDHRKRHKIFDLGYSAIEIDAYKLLNFTYHKTFRHATFEEYLIEEPWLKMWINNTKQNAINNELKKSTNKPVIHSGLDAYPLIVEDCPTESRTWKSGYKQGKSYASVFHNCYDCPFGEVIHDKKYFNGGDTVIDGAIRSVDCRGHSKADVDKVISTFIKLK